jgi:hypothetical protein
MEIDDTFRWMLVRLSWFGEISRLLERHNKEIMSMYICIEIPIFGSFIGTRGLFSLQG